MTHDSTAETLAIREALLASTGRYPKSAAQLFELVRDEWGTLTERRLWRALQKLVRDGLVRRVGERNHSDGYVRVPDTTPTSEDLERARRLDLAAKRLCYDCEQRRLRRGDPSWFRSLTSGYCYPCYRQRNMERR